VTAGSRTGTGPGIGVNVERLPGRGVTNEELIEGQFPGANFFLFLFFSPPSIVITFDIQGVSQFRVQHVCRASPGAHASQYARHTRGESLPLAGPTRSGLAVLNDGKTRTVCRMEANPGSCRWERNFHRGHWNITYFAWL